MNLSRGDFVSKGKKVKGTAKEKKVLKLLEEYSVKSVASYCDLSESEVRKIRKAKLVSAQETPPQIAVQEALSEHQKALRKLAESLRYELRVPSPREAQVETLPKPQQLKDNAGAQLEALARMFVPGPKWRFGTDSFEAFGFQAEGHPLFEGLLEHLDDKNLANKFKELKKSLKEYILLCHNQEGKVDILQLERMPQVTDLLRQSEQLVQELTRGLDLYIHGIIFPGKCRFCHP